MGETADKRGEARGPLPSRSYSVHAVHVLSWRVHRREAVCFPLSWLSLRAASILLSLMGEAPATASLLDILRLPRELGMPCALADVAACALASKSAHKALLEAHNGILPKAQLQILVRDTKRYIWAVEALKYPHDDRAAAAAAGEGEIETLQWLAEQEEQTSFHGPLPLVRSAGRGASLDWGVAVCREAARGGHLHILRYLRLMLGCPWDGSVCANAAAGGHLHVLQWLRQKGCPWHKDTPAWAELNGHMAIKACPAQL